ncbi:MAG: hypothetical protein OPY06_02680 [Nitrosopumilus sp.]|nr:hypothetical protein [Nitrosopumilus sp.]
MKRFETQRCSGCGKEFHGWPCDYCYTRTIINQMESLLCSK